MTNPKTKNRGDQQHKGSCTNQSCPIIAPEAIREKLNIATNPIKSWARQYIKPDQAAVLQASEFLNFAKAQDKSIKTRGKTKTIPKKMPTMAAAIISGVIGQPSCGVIMACLNHPKVIEAYTPESMVVIVSSVPKTWSATSLKSVETPLSLLVIAVSSVLNGLKSYNSFSLFYLQNSSQ